MKSDDDWEVIPPTDPESLINHALKATADTQLTTQEPASTTRTHEGNTQSRADNNDSDDDIGIPSEDTQVLGYINNTREEIDGK
jgi:hypothetical protein